MFDKNEIKTPCYVVDKDLLRVNLELLRNISEKTGCKILLAQKAFSMYSLYPFIKEYLSGTTASSYFEAKLGREEMGGETHIFSPAFSEDEFDQILAICDHVVFNSFTQWLRFKKKIVETEGRVQCGIRINPEYSEIETNMYNPCFENSRLGVTLENLKNEDLSGIDGIHFHTMCEQNSDVLERTLQVIFDEFGSLLSKVKWINFGGGHHITRSDYDVERLIKCINNTKKEFSVEVYLEPGEAVALNTGFLVGSVMEIIENGIKIAILDVSAACHMPDVLEMPYIPKIIDAGEVGEKKYTYRLAGNTCLAGDIIGDYSFDNELEVGDKLVFCDMAHYTMVKNNTFNGIKLPDIAIYSKNQGIKLIKEFGYEDFKSRL